MKKINFSDMNDRELKQYFLENRNDNEAFHAYMDRRHQKKQQVLIEAEELDGLSFSEQANLLAKKLSEKFLKNS